MSWINEMVESKKQFNRLRITRLINNTNPLITLISIISIIAISIFLIAKSFGFDARQYKNYRYNIIYLQQLDADFNQAVLKSRYELFTSYDPLVWNLQQQRSRLKQLTNIPQYIHPKTKQQLNTIFKEVATSIKQKNDLSERFKSRNALLKNSLRYLPLLINQLESKFDNSAQNLTTAQLATLRGNLNKLIRNLLIYNVAVDEKLQSRIESLKDNLLQLKIEYGLTSKDFPINLVASHTNIILNTKPQVEELTSRLVIPLKEKTQVLEDLLKENYQQANLTTNIYRIITIVWVLMLSILLNLILLKKSRTSNPQFSQYKQKISRIANALSEAIAVKNNLSKSNNISDINDLTSCRDSVGNLANSVIKISNQIQQEKVDNCPEESFAFLVSQLTLITKNSQQIFNSDMELKLKIIFALILDNNDCQLLEFQKETDKIRLLFRYSPKIKLSQLIGEIKAESFNYFKQEFTAAIRNIGSSSELWSQAYLIASCDSNLFDNSQSDRSLAKKSQESIY